MFFTYYKYSRKILMLRLKNKLSAKIGIYQMNKMSLDTVR